MNVLVIDIGGTNVKLLASGQNAPLKFPSGPKLTPRAMISQIKKLTKDWRYDAVSVGYPGVVRRGVIVREPSNVAPGWVGFDFQHAFGKPVKVLNDAAMQALGSYNGGTMLFLGLGTGLGSALVLDGVLQPLELGHLSFKRGVYEDYLGRRGLERLGKKKWRRLVAREIRRLVPALELDEVVIGGGNAKKLKKLPAGCRAGSNANAFVGGFRMWDQASPAGSTEMSRNPSGST